MHDQFAPTDSDIHRAELHRKSLIQRWMDIELDNGFTTYATTVQHSRDKVELRFTIREFEKFLEKLEKNPPATSAQINQATKLF